ncbi:hypothetical protein SCHPADRAFT_948351 [Schizopora paradoxa]|uniref:Uncharacterized protein n=1 Tax=Schizopora paradoxa TaxID=27342 RepID=A0A0H2RFR9_9AGAM|nr:hypothetical protein SCHPADRAFT_948351 [Schizopora paradoxa]
MQQLTVNLRLQRSASYIEVETVILTGASGWGKCDIRVWINRRRKVLVPSTTYAKTLKMVALHALLAIIFLIIPFAFGNRGNQRYTINDHGSGFSNPSFAQGNEWCCGASPLLIPDEPLLMYPAVGMTIPNSRELTPSEISPKILNKEINEAIANHFDGLGTVCDGLLDGLLWNL